MDRMNIFYDTIEEHIDEHHPHEDIDWTMVEEDIINALEDKVTVDFWESNAFYEMVHAYVEHIRTTSWFDEKMEEAERLYQEYKEEQRHPYKTRGLNRGMFFSG